MLAVLAYVDGSINSMCWENLLVVGLVGVFYMLAHARFAGRHRLMLVTTEPTPGRDRHAIWERVERCKRYDVTQDATVVGGSTACQGRVSARLRIRIGAASESPNEADEYPCRQHALMFGMT